MHEQQLEFSTPLLLFVQEFPIILPPIDIAYGRTRYPVMISNVFYSRGSLLHVIHTFLLF